MAQKTKEGYKCSICGKIYPDPIKADACRSSHDVIYIPIQASDLNLLLNGIYSGDLSIIPESVLIAFKAAQRRHFLNGIEKKV